MNEDVQVVMAPTGEMVEIRARTAIPHEYRVLARPAPRLRDVCYRLWYLYTGVVTGHLLGYLLRTSFGRGRASFGADLLVLWLACVTGVAVVYWRRRLAQWKRDQHAAMASIARHRQFCEREGTIHE